MLGFLTKVIFLAILVGGIGMFVVNRTGSIPTPESLKAEVENTIKNFDTKTVTSNLSASLDALVTNPDSNSPVVLGVKISNDSLNKIVDTIQSLPPEQVEQVRDILCNFSTPTPAASPTPKL